MAGSPGWGPYEQSNCPCRRLKRPEGSPTRQDVTGYLVLSVDQKLDPHWALSPSAFNLTMILASRSVSNRFSLLKTTRWLYSTLEQSSRDKEKSQRPLEAGRVLTPCVLFPESLWYCLEGTGTGSACCWCSGIEVKTEVLL